MACPAWPTAPFDTGRQLADWLRSNRLELVQEDAARLTSSSREVTGGLYMRWSGQIGEGSLGTTVNYGAIVNEHIYTAEPCAVKAIRMGDRPDMTQDQVKETPDYRRAKKELEFFNYLTNIGTHDNIVRPHMYLARNLHQHDHYWYFLLPLELCDTDLSRAMQAASQAGIHLHDASYQKRKQLLLDIARGLKYLHDIQRAMRDLKPSNVLLVKSRINDSVRAKLADFGQYKTENNRATTIGRHGTVGFVSPEVWNLRISGEGMGPVEDREFWPADIFSFGIIAYMLLAGTGTDSAPHPYDSAPSGSPLGPDALQYRILHDNKRDHYLDLLPENDAEARNLVEATLQRDPKKRPTAQEVVSHPFFYTPTERLHHLNRWSAKLYDREDYTDTATRLDDCFSTERVVGTPTWDQKLTLSTLRDRALSIVISGSMPVKHVPLDQAPPRIQERANLNARHLSRLVGTAFRHLEAHLREFTIREQCELVDLLEDSNSPFLCELRARLLDEYPGRPSTLRDIQPSEFKQLVAAYFHALYPKLSLCLWSMEWVENGRPYRQRACAELFCNGHSRTSPGPRHEGVSSAQSYSSAAAQGAREAGAQAQSDTGSDSPWEVAGRGRRRPTVTTAATTRSAGPSSSNGAGASNGGASTSRARTLPVAAEDNTDWLAYLTSQQLRQQIMGVVNRSQGTLLVIHFDRQHVKALNDLDADTHMRFVVLLAAVRWLDINSPGAKINDLIIDAQGTAVELMIRDAEIRAMVMAFITEHDQVLEPRHFDTGVVRRLKDAARRAQGSTEKAKYQKVFNALTEKLQRQMAPINKPAAWLLSNLEHI